MTTLSARFGDKVQVHPDAPIGMIVDEIGGPRDLVLVAYRVWLATSEGLKRLDDQEVGLPREALEVVDRGYCPDGQSAP